nr:uncharacterized protein LOC127310609 [Lolium perenne]
MAWPPSPATPPPWHGRLVSRSRPPPRHPGPARHAPAPLRPPPRRPGPAPLRPRDALAARDALAPLRPPEPPAAPTRHGLLLLVAPSGLLLLVAPCHAPASGRHGPVTRRRLGRDRRDEQLIS